MTPLTKNYPVVLVTNIAMEHGPFADVFPIENGDVIPASYVSLPEGNLILERALLFFCCLEVIVSLAAAS